MNYQNESINNKTKHLLFDVETTGLNPQKDFIVEIGAILYDSEKENADEFDVLLNWKNRYSGFTTIKTQDIHKITDQKLVEEGLDPVVAMSQFYDFIVKNTGLKESDCLSSPEDLLYPNLNVVCAFNTAYDHNMMISNLKNIIEYLCQKLDINFKDLDDIIKSKTELSDYTQEEKEQFNYLKKCFYLLKLFLKDPLSEDPDIQQNNIIFFDCMIFDRLYHFEDNFRKVHHGLYDVGLRYGLGVDENAHNALSDTRRTLEVYKNQLKEMDELDVNLDNHFETRIIKQYIRNKERWKSNKAENNLDYLGNGMRAAVF